MSRLLIIFCLLLPISVLNAQKEANIWYFGDGGGIDFNDCSLDLAEPGNLPNSIASSSICDSLGNLLFYTDGDVIFDRNHDTMPNGYDLANGAKPAEIITIKKPLDKDIYYIFPVDPLESGNGLSLSIVDMKLNGGLGDVVSKNIKLFHPVTAKLAATRHSNGFETWLIAHEWGSNKFLAFKISPTGVNTVPVVSPIGLVLDGNERNAYGYMSISPDGSRIASCIFGSSTFELYNFNNIFGFVTKNVTVHSDEQFSNPLSIEFSCDASKIYLTCGGNHPNDSSTARMYQMVPYGLGLDVALSAQLIDELESDSAYFGKLQLGPDGRIYVSYKNSDSLGVIDFPSNNHTNIGYRRNEIGLDGNTSNGYLPKYVHPYFNLCLETNSPVCEGEELIIESSFICGGSFFWTGPNSFSSTKQRIVIDRASPDLSGVYNVQVRSGVLNSLGSIDVDVYPNPQADISYEGDGTYCQGDIVTLDAQPSAPDYNYLWSNGETSPSIEIEEPGTYKVLVESEFGCMDSAETEIFFVDSPEVNIIPGDTLVLCEGDSAVLSLNPFDPDNTYLWNTGSTERSITVKSTGIYKVIANNEYDCEDSAFCYVIVYPPPQAEIFSENGYAFCEGDSLILTAEPHGIGYEYLWSNGSTEREITVKEEGRYTVEVMVSEGCKDEAEVNVTKYDSPEITIDNHGQTGFCEGDSLLLSVISDDTGLQYQWSTGETEEEIIAKESGQYFCIAENANGCKDTAFIEVISYPQPDVSIIPEGPLNLCSGAKRYISVNTEFEKYEWSNGQTKKEILVEEPGLYTVEVENEFGCTAYDQIEINYYDISVEFLDLDNTSLHSISIGENVEKSFRMKNISDSTIFVESVALQNQEGIVTVSTQPPVPAFLEPDSVMTITLKSNPSDVNIYYDELIIDITDPCRRIYTLNIKGSTEATTKVWIPQFREKIGTDNLEIPLYAVLETDKDVQLSLDFTATIRFKKNAYYPRTYRNVKVLKDTINESDERIIQISRDDITLTNDTTLLMEMSGLVMNCDSGYTYFFIDDFDWRNTMINIEREHGWLVVYGLCQQQLSLIEPMEPSQMSIIPNPADDMAEIDIETEIAGKYHLSIVNQIGEEIYKKSWIFDHQENKKYTKNISIELNDVASGVYYVLLRSGSGVISKEMIIYK